MALKVLKISLLVIAGLYILLLVVAYAFQDKLIFFPQPLDKNYRYQLTGNN